MRGRAEATGPLRNIGSLYFLALTVWYWRAVSHYKATNDHTVLGKVAEELRSSYLPHSVSSFPAGKLTRRFLWGCTGRKPFAYWNAPSPPGVDVKYCLLKVQKEFADSKTYGGVTEFTSRKSGKTVGGRLSISICHWVKAYSGKFRVDGEVSQCRTVSNV